MFSSLYCHGAQTLCGFPKGEKKITVPDIRDLAGMREPAESDSPAAFLDAEVGSEDLGVCPLPPSVLSDRAEYKQGASQDWLYTSPTLSLSTCCVQCWTQLCRCWTVSGIHWTFPGKVLQTDYLDLGLWASPVFPVSDSSWRGEEALSGLCRPLTLLGTQHSLWMDGQLARKQAACYDKLTFFFQRRYKDGPPKSKQGLSSSVFSRNWDSKSSYASISSTLFISSPRPPASIVRSSVFIAQQIFTLCQTWSSLSGGAGDTGRYLSHQTSRSQGHDMCNFAKCSWILSTNNCS